MTEFESVLRSERERLAKRIEAIDVLLSEEPSLPQRASHRPTNSSNPARKGHKMSAAVREKIRRTQKARWDKIKAGKKA